MARKQSRSTLGRVGRVEREKRINRIISISLIALLVVVVGIVIGGLVIETFITPNKIIATVLGEEITVEDYKDTGKHAASPTGI